MGVRGPHAAIAALALCGCTIANPAFDLAASADDGADATSTGSASAGSDGDPTDGTTGPCEEGFWDSFDARVEDTIVDNCQGGGMCANHDFGGALTRALRNEDGGWVSILLVRFKDLPAGNVREAKLTVEFPLTPTNGRIGIHPVLAGNDWVAGTDTNMPGEGPESTWAFLHVDGATPWVNDSDEVVEPIGAIGPEIANVNFNLDEPVYQIDLPPPAVQMWIDGNPNQGFAVVVSDVQGGLAQINTADSTTPPILELTLGCAG